LSAQVSRYKGVELRKIGIQAAYVVLQWPRPERLTKCLKRIRTCKFLWHLPRNWSSNWRTLVTHLDPHPLQLPAPNLPHPQNDMWILLYFIVRQDKYQNIEYVPMGCEEMHKDMEQIFGRCLKKEESAEVRSCHLLPSNNSNAIEHSCCSWVQINQEFQPNEQILEYIFSEFP